jgi:hypothetical protein
MGRISRTVARYDGKGNINDAGSWVALQPTGTRPETFDWLGSSFFLAHYEKWCAGEGAALVCKDTE